MAKDQPESMEVSAQPVAVAARADQALPMSLDEFCRRLSVTDKRVELIGAFFATEESAGNVSDTAADFAGRYDQFINKPA